jgi:predicted RNA-binding protein
MAETQQAWIIVASRHNMGICADKGVFGLNSKGVMGRMQPGDRLVAYIKGEKTLSGLGTVTQAHYLDDEPLFEGGLFHERIGIELKLLPPEKGIDIWLLVDQLDFVVNKMNWQATLVSGIKQIPMSDFRKIEAALAKGTTSKR